MCFGGVVARRERWFSLVALLLRLYVTEYPHGGAAAGRTGAAKGPRRRGTLRRPSVPAVSGRDAMRGLPLGADQGRRRAAGGCPVKLGQQGAGLQALRAAMQGAMATVAKRREALRPSAWSELCRGRPRGVEPA